MERTRQLIDAAWLAWWAALTPVPFPVEYHSQEFKTPATGPYGRVSVIFGETGPAEIGSGADRVEAMLCLQIFLPPGEPYSLVTQTWDKVRAFWRYKQFEDTTDNVRTHLDFGNPSLTQAGARDGYKQYNIWINFRCDKYFL